MSDDDRDRSASGKGEDGHEGGGAPEWTDRLMPTYQDATRGGREVSASEVEAHEESRPRAGEHDFEADVERIHRPIFREPRDPVEGREPAPWWLWAITAIALFWGGWYLGRFGGTFGTGTHMAFGGAERYVERQAVQAEVDATADPIQAGSQAYIARCQQCHQQSGRGLPPAFPPLIGSEWVTGPPEIVVLIILHGLQGPIEVAGAPYNGVMPGWGTLMTDAEIAAVSTYIRQWETNDASPVTPELVRRLREATADRQQAWTPDELRAAAESPEIRAAVEGAGEGPGGGQASPEAGVPGAAPPDATSPAGPPVPDAASSGGGR